MRAGYGKSEITPPLGVELAGYGYYLNRCAHSIQDPLYARAVLLEKDGMRSLIISCDLLGLSKAVCSDVFRHTEKAGIPGKHVIIVSTHTHTGPAIKYHEGCGLADEAYVSTVAGRICQAIDAATADLTDVTALRQSFSPFEGNYIHNRTAQDGPVDRFVRGFILTRRNREPICLISAACHGVFRGRVTAVSADFAGEINRIMEKQGYRSIYLNGLCGDIDPLKPTEERLKEFAQVIVNAFISRTNALYLSLKSGYIPFTLKLTFVTAMEIRGAAEHAVEMAGGPEKPAARVALAWKKEMLERLCQLKDTEDIVCKYLVLGGVPIVAFPFEGFTKVGQDIRNIACRPDSLMLGCGEELLGYLPTRDDIARKAYAALESTFLYKRLPAMAGEAERLGREIGYALKEILA